MKNISFLDDYYKFHESYFRHHPLDETLAEKLYTEYKYFFDCNEEYAPVSFLNLYVKTTGASTFLSHKLNTYLYIQNVLAKKNIGNEEKVFSIEGLVQFNDSELVRNDDSKIELQKCRITSETIIRGTVTKEDIVDQAVTFFEPLSRDYFDLPNNTIQNDFNVRFAQYNHEYIFFKLSEIKQVSKNLGITLVSDTEAKYRVLNRMLFKHQARKTRIEYTSKKATDFIEKLELKFKRDVLAHISRLEAKLANANIETPLGTVSYSHTTEYLEIMDKLIWVFWENHNENEPPNNAAMESYMLEHWPNKFKQNSQNKLNKMGSSILTILRPEKYRNPYK